MRIIDAYTDEGHALAVDLVRMAKIKEVVARDPIVVHKNFFTYKEIQMKKQGGFRTDRNRGGVLVKKTRVARNPLPHLATGH